MQRSTPLFLPLLLAASLPVTAANLMLDFGNPAANSVVASPYLTLSPGHDALAISGTETSWNTLTTSADRSNLVYADNSSATGITVDLGQEATGGDNIINFGTTVGQLTLAGTGGSVPGQQSLLGTGSIYGDNTSSTAAGRDGFFGGGAATTNGAAIGVRIDGLTAGDYRVYVMGRNTNTNTASSPMRIYSTVTTAGSTFDFSLATAMTQANSGYASVGYANQFNTFVNGENFVAVDITVASGSSFFLAVDGGNTAVDRRGFLNVIQVVSVPEPSTALLGALGLLFLVRRRK